MSSAMEMNQEIQQVLRTSVSPRLIAANHILEMSSQELQEAVALEIDENPALDMVDMVICPTCGQPVDGEACPRCARKQEEPHAAEQTVDPTEQYLENLAWNTPTVNRDDDFDPLTLVAAQ